MSCDEPAGPPTPVASARGASPRPRVVVAITVGIGVLVAAGLLLTDPVHLLPLDLVVGVLGVALVPALLRRPLPGAALLVVLGGLSPAATPPATAAVFHVAQVGTLRASLLVAGAGSTAHLLRGWWRPVAEGLPYEWWALLILAVHAMLLGWGRFAQARRELLASLRERARRLEADQERRVSEARQAERARIAREMHDVLAHRLSLVATHAGALEYRPDQTPDRLATAAGVVRQGVHQALDELRGVIGVLRHDATDDEGERGDDDRPQPTLADLDRLLEENRRAGARIALELDVEPDAVPPATARTAYRIVQESLTNARRHAPGTPVTARVSGVSGESLAIEVENPLAVPADPAPAGTGLVGLRERVELAGGTLEVGTLDGRFRVLARLPWCHGSAVEG